VDVPPWQHLVHELLVAAQHQHVHVVVVPEPTAHEQLDGMAARDPPRRPVADTLVVVVSTVAGGLVI
jgi:hypothetical protein